MRDETRPEHGVERLRPQRQRGHVGEQQLPLTVASGPYGGLQHGRGQIGPEHHSRPPHGRTERRQCASRAAARVEHAIPLAQTEFGDRVGVGGAVVGEAAVPIGGACAEELLDMCGSSLMFGMIPHRHG